MEDKEIVWGPSKRERAIMETGKDPKTGLTAHPIELTEETRIRGGRRSRRRTARVWKRSVLAEPTAD